ncbi:MAG: redox-sensing transcriptional repressor Rex [Oscillospiraceae bacterium]|nr:redox-sensing transcriptional repressor Rex [Oscillospiraceae bacterium]
MPRNQYVSSAVIKRLPRYYRFLGELLERGVTRISSKELAELMKLTASQIRQDLNCFGGFGQQGYGYNVALLRDEIKKILGLDKNLKAILIGVGNLGRAFSANINFTDAGFDLCALFDKNPEVIGSKINGYMVRGEDEIEQFCHDNKIDMAILCVPSEAAQGIADHLIDCGITSFWNFTHYDIEVSHPEVIVENVHLSDSLMALCYMINDIKRSVEEDN